MLSLTLKICSTAFIMKTLFTVFALLLLCPPNTAFADAATAARLQTLFATMLEEQKTLTAIDGETTMETKGDITVEDAKDYYAITLPHITYQSQDGNSMDIGIIAINATPHNEEGQWKMTFALPTPIRVTNAKNPESPQTTEINIGKQKASGIFHEDLRQFSKFDAEYKDISVGRGANALTIGSIITRADMSIDDNNLWSGPATITFNDLKAGTNGTKSQAKIKTIMFNMLMDQQNPAIYRQHKNTILALQAQGAFDNPDKISKATTEKLSESTFDMITKSMNGYAFKYKLSGIDITNRKGENIKISTTEGSMNAGGFLTGNKVNLGLNLKYNGLDSSALSQSDKDIIPSQTDLGIDIKNIPFIELTKLGQNTLASHSKGKDIGKAMQMASIGLMFKLPGILSQAGTTIEIKDNLVKNDIYTFAFDGQIRADITAAKSATANITALFTGLDTLMAKLSATIQNPASSNLDKFANLYDQLERFRSLATKDGETHKIDLTLDEKGDLLLNGQDALKAIRAK